MDSLMILRQLEGMTLPEAKTAIHLSPTWSDRYEADEALHDQVEAVLHTFGQPGGGGEAEGRHSDE